MYKARDDLLTGKAGYELCCSLYLRLGQKCHRPTVYYLVERILQRAGWGKSDAEKIRKLADVNSEKTPKIAIVSADYKECCTMDKKLAVIYFSNQAQNLLVRRTLGAGGRGVFVKEDIVYAASGAFAHTVGPVGQKLRENVLAAVAITWGSGIPVWHIRQELGENSKSFS